MQIHEITLREAAPVTQSVRQNVNQLRTQRKARAMPTAAVANPTTPATPADPWQEKLKQAQQQGLGMGQVGNAAAVWLAKKLRPGGPAGTAPTTPPAQQLTPPAPATKPTTPPAQQLTPPATATTVRPPITIGSGPKAQVWVWTGSQYIDQKTKKPMEPTMQQSFIKAQGQ
jgi:hypothetical protein